LLTAVVLREALSLCFMMLFSLPSMIDENKRLKNGQMVIGLQFSTLLKSFSGLGIRVILFPFHSSGNPEQKTIILSNFPRTIDRPGIFRCFFKIPSGPAAALPLILLIFSIISSLVIGGNIAFMGHSSITVQFVRQEGSVVPYNFSYTSLTSFALTINLIGSRIVRSLFITTSASFLGHSL
jgi:hypothetical protein